MVPALAGLSHQLSEPPLLSAANEAKTLTATGNAIRRRRTHTEGQRWAALRDAEHAGRNPKLPH